MASTIVMAFLAVAVLVQTKPPVAQRSKQGSVQRTSVSVNEPFQSFRTIDGKLTLLNNQVLELTNTVDHLKNTSPKHGRGARSAPPWARQIRQMRRPVFTIQVITARLRSMYRRRHQPFGIRVFSTLHKKAITVDRRLEAVGKAQDAGTAKNSVADLKQAVLALVLQFQAASGGYGALHCSPGMWACCEPKKREAGIGAAPEGACKWTCAQRTRQCTTGFLGPRTRQP